MQENFNGISEMSGNKVIEKPPENGQNIHRSEPKCVQEETNKISSNETLKNDIKHSGLELWFREKKVTWHMTFTQS